jgi:murein DD-endopeptidase MepM/ murein hydrolase activator NlpD
VIDGPRRVDGLIWWQIRARMAAQEVTGWLAETSPTGAALIAKATSTPGTPPPAGIAGRFAPGDTVYTNGYVNLRRSPGYVGKTSDDIVVEIPYGSAIAIGGGPQTADELTWWQVDYTTAARQKTKGWTAERAPKGHQLLSKQAPPPPPPVQTPIFNTYRMGDAVCNLSAADVNIRKSPGYRNKPADDVVALVPSKALLRLVDGPREADGLHWWRVQGQVVDRTLEGWMAEVSPAGMRLLAPALFRDAIALSIPFQGNHRVSQLWGDNAGFYRQFTYDGVALRGHNGIDFAMPIGTPLLAADAGTVQTVGASPKGFGNWIMLDHRWGQSVYAHMHRITVREGQAIGRGDRLGESGNSGTSTGPHLHFSIRITPYFRGDGWGGYCDPLPFMEADKLNIPAGIRGEGPEGETIPPSPPPIEEPGRPLP